MKRILTRTLLLACVVATAASAMFVQVASANYLGSASITCDSVTFNYSTFPSGDQTMMETVFVDGAIATQTFATFTGPTGTHTLQFSVPNDGLPHYIEAYGYSITNATTVLGFPAVATLTCGTTPPPPPGKCTYTKGFYRNHPDVTASVIATMGGTVKLGSANLNTAQAQAVLNTTPNQPSNVTYSSNLLLNLAQQVITAELNVARGSTASAGILNAIASANAAIVATTNGGGVQLSSALSTDSASALNIAIEGFNSASDCG